jgi:hypothetical protein
LDCDNSSGSGEVANIGCGIRFLTGGSRNGSPVVPAKGEATIMLARKLMLLMTAFATGLYSLGYVLAEDPKPAPPVMAPNAVSSAQIVPPITPETDLGQPAVIIPAPHIPGTLTPAQLAEQREPCVWLNAMCVKMPAGFCEECGFTIDNLSSKVGDKASSIAICLSEREAKMLKALIPIYPERRTLSNPVLIIADGQRAHVQAGGKFPIVADAANTSSDEKTIPTDSTKNVEYLDIGTSFEVTPKISKDGRYIMLKVEPRISELVSGQIEVPGTPLGFRDSKAKTQVRILRPGKGDEGLVHVQCSLPTTIVVPVGGTAVIGSTVSDSAFFSSEGEPKKVEMLSEMLWIVTAQVIRPEK